MTQIYNLRLLMTADFNCLQKMKFTCQKSRSGISLIEVLLIVATIVLVALAIVPSYHNASEAIVIERTARLLADPHTLTNAATVWPIEARLETLDSYSVESASVVLSLKSGERRVTAADAAADIPR